MSAIGPIQLLTVEFGPSAKFEGRVIEELIILESNGQIRVLDMLFVQKETDGRLTVLDYQAEDMGDTVAALLGISRDSMRGAEKTFPSVSEGSAFGLTLAEITDTAQALEPGTAAAFILFEHVWAKYLRAAIRNAGGVPVAEGFLTEEALLPIAAELVAVADRRGEPIASRHRTGPVPEKPAQEPETRKKNRTRRT
ncbi:DUF1269 domain-containing protein [Streptomyces sp. Je 1-369]|uniref:DUF1269 domain-containing protein n=1 Tax=Streptomyces sp. Je 1-369 TaxID=2966192 RepID=UPI00228622A1|nr:DUF1269 domain-containing protein [Streptomyces sp. Je 1-369]WAL96467.1 DUF1269 domain-containing protein [Streptomyces sp. Je 1-369]